MYIASTEEIGNFQYKIIIKNIRQGVGQFLSNTIRRGLLSSVQGYAITKLQIDGVIHEFDTSKILKEDIISILHNFSSLHLKNISELQSQEYNFTIKGPLLVSGRHLEEQANIEVFNKDHHLCTVTSESLLNIQYVVESGKGYTIPYYSSDEHITPNYMKTLANFNPILHVQCTHYVVDRYDEIAIFVTTKGNINIKEAIFIIMKDTYSQLQPLIKYFKYNISNKGLDQIGLDKTIVNILFQQQIITLYDLTNTTLSTLTSIPKLGKIRSQQIINFLAQHNLSLKE
jgi:DNA-directed RNA polymerase subunit alpha